MRHFFSTKVRVILIAAVLLTAALAILSSITGASFADTLVQGLLAPVRYTATALTDQAEQLYSYMFEYESLAAENEVLKQRISELEDEARQADSYQRENERLRDALELTEVHEEWDLVDGYIIARSSTDWTSTITINRGTAAGIDTGMCALTENGEVIGLVSEAGSSYAVIKTVMDSTIEISATIAATGYNGMVQGGYTDGRKDLLRMDYLPSSAVIRNNDQVVTAGSTVYPRNLIMGYVVDAGFDDTGVAKYAMLEPAVELGSLEQVFILTNYTTSE